MKVEPELWHRLHYEIVPPLFIVVFTFAVQILAYFGSADEGATWSLIGNKYSWTVVGILMLWAILSLKV